MLSSQIAVSTPVDYRRQFNTLCFFVLAVLLLWASSASPQAVSGSVAVVPVINTVAGTPGTPMAAGFSGDSGPATSADLNYPGSVAVDKAGNIYIADSANQRVRAVAGPGVTSIFGQTVIAGDIYTIAGTGTAGSAGDGGAAVNAQLNNPYNVAVDSAGNLYIADTSNQRIRMIAVGTGVINTIAGNGTSCNPPASCGDGGAAISAQLRNPYGLAVDAAGDIYIADTANFRIRVIAAAGVTNLFGQSVTAGDIYTVAGNGTSGYNGNGMAATSAELHYPYSVAVDSAGNLFIADYNNQRVRVVAANGVSTIFGQVSFQGNPVIPGDIYTVAGTGMGGYSGDNIAASTAELNGPVGVAVDASNNLYIAEYDGQRVRIIAASTGTLLGQSVTVDDIYTIAGTGNYGSGGNGFAATNADLRRPRNIAIDALGNFYIADFSNQWIREVSAIPAMPTTAVRSSASAQNVLVALPAGGAITSITVPAAQNGAQEFSVGSPSGCFVNGNFNAPGSTCIVPVTFTPQYPGQRTGALTLKNSSGILGTLGMSAMGTGPLGVFSPGTASVEPRGSYTLNNIGGVAIDPTGDLYFSDYPSNQVFKVSTSGVTSVTTGNIVLNNPTGLALDPAGDLYIANYGSNNIIEVTAEGKSSLMNMGSLTVPLQEPVGLTEDAAGNLYIADRHNNRIVKVSAAGVVSVVNTGSVTLNHPNGVGVDSNGNLFIADRDSNRIVEVSSTGVASVVVNYTTLFSGTPLQLPTGVAVDSAENIYITDFNGNRLVEYSAAGVASVISTGATPLANPHDLVLDGAGNIYVANWGGGSGPYTVVELSQAVTPTLNFGSSDTGTATAQQIVSLQNIGNQALDFTALDTSTMGQPSSSFNLNGAATTCDATTSLGAGATCGLGVEFDPLIAGSFSGTANITDNNLNSAGSIQQVSLTGTGVSVAATMALNESPGTSVVYGTSVTVTATLTGSNGTPSGSISYTLDGTAQPDVTLSSGGVATFTLPGTLAVGTHNIVVSYLPGDPHYQTQTPSQSFTLTVSAYASATTLTTSKTTITFGQSVTFTAAVTANGSPVTSGTVTFQFTNGSGGSLGAATLNGSGIATLTTTNLPVGNDQITASLVANVDDAASTSAPVSVTVNAVSPLPTTTTLTASAPSITYGQSETLTATVTANGSPVTSGTVTFSNGSNSIGAAPLNSSGVATLTTTALPVGSDSITATFIATPSDSTSTSTPPTVVTVSAIPALTTNTTLTASAASITYGQSETLRATVTDPNGPVTSGTVTFSNGSNSIGAGSLNGSGVATLMTTSLPIGSDSITATFIASASDSASTSTPVVVTVTGSVASGSGATTATALTVSPTSSNFGQTITLTAAVSSSSAGTPTGTIAFYYGVTSLGAATVSNGTASLTTNALGAGSDVLTAQYSGDNNFNTSTSPETIETVAGPSISIALGSNSVSVAAGASATDTLTITPQGGFTGTLQLACANLPANASCSFKPTSVTIGAGAGAQAVQVTVQTAGTAALQVWHPFGQSGSPNLTALATVFWLPGWFLTALVGVKGKKKGLSTRSMHLFVLLLLLSGVGMLTACAGGKPPASSAVSTPVASTPIGNSAALVVVTGANNLAQVAPFTLTVH